MSRLRAFADVPAERGSLAIVMALFGIGLFAMAGLVIDGGAALAARGRASDLAEQASRAGADALAPDSLRGASPQALRIDPVAANTAAREVLSAGRATGNAKVVGREVSVTARVARRSVVLSAFGITDLSGTASATATVLYGTTSGDTP